MSAFKKHWARTPNKARFYGYTAKHQKCGNYPFDPTAIKQYKISNSESATMIKPSDSITTSTPQDEFESSQIEVPHHRLFHLVKIQSVVPKKM